MMHLVTCPEVRFGSSGRSAGAAHLVLAAGVVHLDPQTAVFEAMVEGWARQQRSRLLAEGTVGKRVRLVRRFAEFTSEYPWSWQPGDVEEFSVSLRGDARGTVERSGFYRARRCGYSAILPSIRVTAG